MAMKIDDVKNDSSDSSDIDTKITSLSDEMLIKIIKLVHLTQWPSLESVSRQFRNVVFEAWLGLKKIRLINDLRAVEQEQRGSLMHPIGRSITAETQSLTLEKLTRRAPNITDLSGLSCYDLILDDATIRLSRFGELRRIDLSGSVMNCNGFATFLLTSSSRGRLKDLTIGKLSVYAFVSGQHQYQYDEEYFNSAFGNADPNLPPVQLEKFGLVDQKFDKFGFANTIDVSRLTALDVSDAQMNSNDLLTLVARATNLTSFGFCFTTSSFESVGHLYVQIMKIISTSEKLLSLKIGEGIRLDGIKYGLGTSGGCCPPPDMGYRINDELIKMITDIGRNRRSRLEEFTLLDENFCTQSMISAIADNMTQLKSLHLRLHSYCSIDSLSQIGMVTKLNRLEKLTLWRESGISGDVIKAIAANLIELKSLNLWYCDEAEKPKMLKELALLSNLKKLIINYRHMVEHSSGN